MPAVGQAEDDGPAGPVVLLRSPFTFTLAPATGCPASVTFKAVLPFFFWLALSARPGRMRWWKLARPPDGAPGWPARAYEGAR